jgi:anaerobic magnesium-protoporphyrin IX monomethyl ester cyclase
MRWLQETYAPDHIWFADDIMGLKPGWWPEFAAEVQAQGVRLPFKCLSRADLIVRQPENVAALRQANCAIVWLGAESGSQRILDAMEKGTTVAQIRDAARQLQAAGVKVGFFLQFGYPGETWADIQRRSSWCAIACPTTSAFRCRTRCRAPAFMSGWCSSWAPSKIGSIRPIWR